MICVHDKSTLRTLSQSQRNGIWVLPRHIGRRRIEMLQSGEAEKRTEHTRCTNKGVSALCSDNDVEVSEDALDEQLPRMLLLRLSAKTQQMHKHQFNVISTLTRVIYIPSTFIILQIITSQTLSQGWRKLMHKVLKQNKLVKYSSQQAYVHKFAHDILHNLHKQIC